MTLIIKHIKYSIGILHTCHINNPFPGEPGLASCHLYNKGVEVNSFMGGMPFLSPNQQHQSTEGLMDLRLYMREDAWPADKPTPSVH